MNDQKTTRDKLAYFKGLNLLPDHMRGGMLRYIEHGIPPGKFLRAVLSNDLMEAMGRADSTNLHALPAYGRYLYNEAPAGCYGSRERYDAWIEGGGLVGKDVIEDPGISNL